LAFSQSSIFFIQSAKIENYSNEFQVFARQHTRYRIKNIAKNSCYEWRTRKTDNLQEKLILEGIPRWQLEGGNRKPASYSEILERSWRHTLQS
jgi:hypothetical protein